MEIALRPAMNELQYGDYTLVFKTILKKQKAFSYRCINVSKFKCPYLLTIPIEGNYDPVTFKCTNILGAFQASSLGHSEQCKKNVANAKQINQSLLCPIIQPVSFAE